MYYSPILSFIRLLTLTIWTLICAPMQFFFRFSFRYFFVILKIYFKGLLFIFGIKINKFGVPDRKKTVFISNHTSYLDILILGSNVEGLFVAKSEISNWPVINKLCNLANTIFISRKKIFSTKNQIKIINNRLKAGYNIILFPEGTSNDGNKVLPFKSSLFSITEFPDNKNFRIQPVSITYSRLDGIPLSRIFKPFFAWYGNMELLPHAWKLLGIGNCEINLHYHKSLKFDEFSSRKEFSNHCYKIISNQVSIDFSNVDFSNQPNLYNYKHL